ncbi:MAG: hypothetical protein WKF91_20545 [Segetibacter sp.]
MKSKRFGRGAPVSKGTRVPIKTLFDYMEEESLEEFLLGFSSVTGEQAEGVIEIVLISEL